MAQYVGVLCDWCAHLGIEDVPAAVQRVVAVDGPARRVDLCHRCDLALAPFLALYEVGQDLPDERPRARRTAGRRGRRQEPGPGPETPPQPEQQPTRRRGGRVRDESKPSVVCPLDHPHSGGGPQRVSYGGRNSHADMVHGLHFTQIAWQDPDHILAFPCDAHAACRAHQVSFTSKVGLTNHLNRYREAAADPAPDAPVVASLPAPAVSSPFFAEAGE